MARDSREFTATAVRRAAEDGITQFLDLGCGYPPRRGTAIHDIARSVTPAARVAHVDIDQDAAAYSSWRYHHELGLQGISVTCADLRDAGAVLAAPEVRAVISPAGPLRVVGAMTLHFMAPADAAAAAAAYMARCAPGSILAATVSRNDDPVRWEQVSAAWSASTGTPIFNFTRAGFAGLEIAVAPVAGPRGSVHVLGGAGRKPAHYPVPPPLRPGS